MTNQVLSVMFDPGHGGRDPGAAGNGLQEKNIVLDISLRAGAYLIENYENVVVHYTRTTDDFVELAERTRLANIKNVDAFVSVHVNGFSNAQANGFETHIHNGALSTGTQHLQREIHNAIWAFMVDNGIQQNRGMRQANLHVLRETNMAAVLTENLFITNAEALRFNDESFLQGVAVAHAIGVANFLGLTKRGSGGNSNSDTTQQTHTVVAGDTLSAIARKFNVTANAIAHANNIDNPNNIAIGQVLIIPGTTESPGGSSNNNNVANQNTHVVSQATPAFTTAANALNNRDPRGTVQPGTFYVFNQSNGMINVTRAPKQPGSWINPNLTVTAPTQRFFPVPANQDLGLVDSLNSIGVNSSLANRKVIGRANGITIDGLAGANQQMLVLLRQGRLVRP